MYAAFIYILKEIEYARVKMYTDKKLLIKKVEDHIIFIMKYFLIKIKSATELSMDKYR